MRTMYIILSWVGWGWFLIAGTFLAIRLPVALKRRRGSQTHGSQTQGLQTIGTEAEHADEQ